MPHDPLIKADNIVEKLQDRIFNGQDPVDVSEMFKFEPTYINDVYSPFNGVDLIGISYFPTENIMSFYLRDKKSLQQINESFKKKVEYVEKTYVCNKNEEDKVPMMYQADVHLKPNFWIATDEVIDVGKKMIEDHKGLISQGLNMIPLLQQCNDTREYKRMRFLMERDVVRTVNEYNSAKTEQEKIKAAGSIGIFWMRY